MKWVLFLDFVFLLMNVWTASGAIKRRDYFWLILSLFLGLYFVLKMALV